MNTQEEDTFRQAFWQSKMQAWGTADCGLPGNRDAQADEIWMWVAPERILAVIPLDANKQK